jgi:hypothetical protein
MMRLRLYIEEGSELCRFAAYENFVGGPVQLALITLQQPEI